MKILKRVVLCIVWIVVVFVELLIVDFLLVNVVELQYILEVGIPIFCKRENIDTYSPYFNNGEGISKLYLSEKQSNNMLDDISKNEYWKELPIREDINKKIKEYADLYDDNLYSKIPEVKNGYWFFKERTSGTEDVYAYENFFAHSASAFSIGIFDTDENSLYYYTYDR